MSDPASNPFWAFSLRVYRRPGVAPACLRLQDSHGVDVNLLLYFCWRGSVDAAAMPRSEIDAAMDLTEDWRKTVVRPLRAMRRRMKTGFEGFDRAESDTLRSEVKRIELEAERQQQTALFESGGGNPTTRHAVRSAQTAGQNVASYLDALGVAPDDGVQADCALIIAGCIDE